MTRKWLRVLISFSDSFDLFIFFFASFDVLARRKKKKTVWFVFCTGTRLRIDACGPGETVLFIVWISKDQTDSYLFFLLSIVLFHLFFFFYNLWEKEKFDAQAQGTV